MINGGVLGGSAGTSGSPVRSSSCTFSAPLVRGHGAAARQAAEASAAGLSGRASVSGRLVQGIRRRALYGCSSGRTHPFTSSRKQSGTASPAVVTSAAGPSSALMQMMMPKVSVETLAFDGLSSHAALLKEAPMVRACLLVLLARVQNWEEVFLCLHAINKSTLFRGGPEVGKATFLRRFCAFFAPALVRVGGRHCRWPNGKLGSDLRGANLPLLFCSAISNCLYTAPPPPRRRTCCSRSGGIRLPPDCRFFEFSCWTTSPSCKMRHWQPCASFCCSASW